MMTHTGSCHCRRVRFEVDTDLGVETVLECNCSMCRRKGFLHLIVEPGHFRLLDGRDSLQEYRFNTEVAVHRFCETCGIHPFYTPRSHPDKIDVNVRCLEGVSLDELEIEPFDGRRWEENVADIQES